MIKLFHKLVSKLLKSIQELSQNVKTNSYMTHYVHLNILQLN